MEAAPEAPQHGGAHVAAAAPPPRMSAEAFLQGTTVAWSYLMSVERKAIRACCRAGRLQHDRMLRELRVALVDADGYRSDDGAGNRAPPPPSQMHTSLQRMVGRGARPQLLSMYFADWRNDQREAYLLAALEACSSSPLVDLALRGAVPLSGVVAEAVEACCPQLHCLTLDERYGRLMQEALTGEEASEYHYSCVQLLSLCGPRLRRLWLQLREFYFWQPVSYMALRRCTALVRLELEAGRTYDAGFDAERGEHRGGSADAHLFGVVSHVRTLQELHLVNEWCAADCPPNAVRPHATCAARLSALTGLMRLYLVLSGCYEHDGYSFYKQQQDGEQHGAWVEVREAHRTSLLSALRCMPQLQHLDCNKLWLRPSELPVSLTALTSLTVGGLLPPPVEEGAGDFGDGGGIPARLAESGALPPQLRQLVMGVGASPRALAQLQPPPYSVHLHVPTLYFGVSDVEGGKLRPEAVAAVGPAVRTLVACRHPTRGPTHPRPHATTYGTHPRRRRRRPAAAPRRLPQRPQRVDSAAGRPGRVQEAQTRECAPTAGRPVLPGPGAARPAGPGPERLPRAAGRPARPASPHDAPHTPGRGPQQPRQHRRRGAGVSRAAAVPPAPRCGAASAPFVL